MPISKSAVWVVVPAYNEVAYLTRFLTKLLKYTQNVVVVDDGSVDNTMNAARKLGVLVLQHQTNLGKGAALRTGCRFAFEELQAQAVILMDGDDQHDPSDLPLFYEALAADHQVIFGIRQEPQNMPWLKLKINRLSSLITALLFGKYILDIPSGFKAFTREAFQQIKWEAADYAVELEIAAKTAKYQIPFTTVCIKTIYHDMNKGFSALNILSMVRHIIKLKLTL